MIPTTFDEAVKTGFVPYMVEAKRTSLINYIIKDFKSLVRKGYNPNDYIEEILSNYGLSEDELTDKEIEKINNSVNGSSYF